MADQATPPPDPDEIVDAQVVGDQDLAAPPDDRPLPAAVPTPRPDLPPLPSANVGGAGPPGMVTLYGTVDPNEIVKTVTNVANALANVIKEQGLAKNLGGNKDHVEIEGWQTAGTLLGLQAMTIWTGRVHPIARYKVRTKRKKWGWVNGKREITEETTNEWVNEGWSYEAIAEVRTLDGRIVGRGEAICSRRETNWFEAEDSAVKGMAQTRAQSRAFKQALGFIIGLAGYSSTPKEEMDAAGVEAPGPTETGPPFGRALKDQDKRLLLERLTALLTHPDLSEDQNKRSALRVIAALKKEAGDYTPYIAAFALITAANVLEAADPEKIEERAAREAQKAHEAPDETPEDGPPADVADDAPDQLPEVGDHGDRQAAEQAQENFEADADRLGEELRNETV
jgi:hypothetical protein